MFERVDRIWDDLRDGQRIVLTILGALTAGVAWFATFMLIFGYNNGGFYGFMSLIGAGLLAGLVAVWFNDDIYW